MPTTGAANTASGFEALRSNTTGASKCRRGWQQVVVTCLEDGSLPVIRKNLVGWLAENHTVEDGPERFLRRTHMRRTQLVAALLICAVLSLPRAGSAQSAAPIPLVVEDAGPPYTTAVGYQAAANTTGNNNTAIGYEALYANTSGAYNTATGDHALY